MGGSQSVFDQKELEDYQELTYFTKNEILHVWKRFADLVRDGESDVKKDTKLTFERIKELPELRVNPFCERIFKVFSSSDEGNTYMTFEDFLDMMSVFSDNAPKNVKVEYAFRIYDYDGDDMISEDDLKSVINTLTGEHKLEESEMNQLVDNVLEEADLDEDRKLSFAEFEHVISKAPDFINSFRIRL